MKNLTLNESINDMQNSASTQETLETSMSSSYWENNDSPLKEGEDA